ncbi:hypothetical protein P7C73_g2606, partial [Tremellales sp. Uapishka_1]
TPHSAPPPVKAEASQPEPAKPFSFRPTTKPVAPVPIPQANPPFLAVADLARTPTFTPIPVPRVSSNPSLFDDTPQPVAGPSTPSLASPPKPVVKVLSPIKVRVKRPVVEGERASIAVLKSARKTRKETVSSLADDLITEVLLSMFEPQLKSIVKQELAAREYAAAKAARHEMLHGVAASLYAQLEDDCIRQQAEGVAQLERRRRFLIKRAVHHWKVWTKRMIRERETLRREREEMFSRLDAMGLGRSVSIRGEERDLDMERMDEFEIDVSLHQTERARKQLLESTTFLSSIARHVAPLLEPAHTPTSLTFSTSSLHSSVRQLPVQETIWHTLVSLSSSSSAEEWLAKKFQTKDGEAIEEDGVVFESNVVGRFDEIPTSTHYGLVVFEAPLSSLNGKQKQKDDANDRMRNLLVTTQGRNRYRPVLLFLTWEDESQQDLVQRLDVQDEIQEFYRVQVLSMQEPMDLDYRFTVAIEKLIVDIPRKQQLVIRLDDLVDGLYPTFERFLETARLVLNRLPNDPSVPRTIMSAALEVINAVTVSARLSLGKMKESGYSTFQPLNLPPFEYKPATSMDIARRDITDYLSNDFFKDIDDVSLLIPSFHDTKTPLPLVDLIATFGLLVFSDLKPQSLPLVYFLPPHEANACLHDCYQTAGASYTESVDEKIRQITSALETSTSAPAPVPSFLHRPPSPIKKRDREEEGSPIKESKAVKAARLKKVMGLAKRDLMMGIEA